MHRTNKVLPTPNGCAASYIQRPLISAQYRRTGIIDHDSLHDGEIWDRGPPLPGGTGKSNRGIKPIPYFYSRTKHVEGTIKFTNLPSPPTDRTGSRTPSNTRRPKGQSTSTDGPSTGQTNGKL